MLHLIAVYQCQCASVPFSGYHNNDGSWRYQVTKSPFAWTFFLVKDITVPGTFLDDDFHGCLYRVDPWGADGCFLKWWYPTTMGFPTKNDHFGVFWGYHHFRKPPDRSITSFKDEAISIPLELHFLTDLFFRMEAPLDTWIFT